MRAAMIGRPYLIAITVGKCTLNRVGMPFAAFVEQRGRHGPKTMRGHLIAGVAQRIAMSVSAIVVSPIVIRLRYPRSWGYRIDQSDAPPQFYPQRVVAVSEQACTLVVE